jgi:integrase
VALSDSKLRSAKAGPKPYKLYDAGGLFLVVTPSAGKLWRLKYRYSGKEQLLTLGSYPAVGIAKARMARDAALELLADGKNPAAEKKRERAAKAIATANTFKAVADEFIAKREREGVADITTAKAKWLLGQLEPALGTRPISEIEPFELLDVLKRIEAAERYETAKRLLAFAGRVFRYAVATTRAKHDIAADLKGALTAPKVKHHAAILDPARVGALLRAIDGFDGQVATKLALKLAPHVFVRPGELRQAEWSEIDLEAAVWRIPAAKMKMRQEHAVPLSKQSVAILREAQKLSGRGRFVFPSVRTNTRPMSENTINAALRRLGYGTDEMTGHGFRSTASTLLNESGKWSTDAIERALAHRDSDTVRAAYHRGSHWQERVSMAEWWSDHLDTLRHSGQIIPVKFGANG